MEMPYYAPTETLPTSLPTVAEIVASKDLFPCIFEKRYICRVGEHFLIKYGNVKLDEAENMYVLHFPSPPQASLSLSLSRTTLSEEKRNEYLGIN